MKDFISDCFDNYASTIVRLLWIPVMIICLPIALVAVSMKFAYAAMSDIFIEDKDE
tara:strand:- start:419 stop:586 length:168 start_codon:yes stop_codon:yes gene_type:complete